MWSCYSGLWYNNPKQIYIYWADLSQEGELSDVESKFFYISLQNILLKTHPSRVQSLSWLLSGCLSHGKYSYQIQGQNLPWKWGEMRCEGILLLTFTLPQYYVTIKKPQKTQNYHGIPIWVLLDFIGFYWVFIGNFWGNFLKSYKSLLAHCYVTMVDFKSYFSPCIVKFVLADFFTKIMCQNRMKSLWKS